MNKCFDKKGNYWELSEEIFGRINDVNRQQYVYFMTDNPHIAKRKLVKLNSCNKNHNNYMLIMQYAFQHKYIVFKSVTI